MAYNASQTKSGVVYDIRNSPFTSKRHGMTFRFSSMSHKEKWDAKVHGKEEWLTDSMTRRFHMPFDCAVLAAFQLYMQIEGRGFSVFDEYEGREYTCPQEVLFAGLPISSSDSSKPSRATTETWIG